MTSDPDAYVALMASLPSSERLFVAKKPPLSRFRLDRRLTALAPEDAATLRILEQALAWANYDLDVTDDQAIARTRRAMDQVPHPTLRAVLRDRLEVRSILAALRLRHSGAPPPAPTWGHGRFRRQIAARWAEPAFGLDANQPWIKEANSLIEARDPFALERLVLTVTFRQMRRRGAAHHFDFEAVAIYVLCWSIFDRWARANAEAAARRFNDLADAAIAHCPNRLGRPVSGDQRA